MRPADLGRALALALVLVAAIAATAALCNLKDRLMSLFGLSPLRLYAGLAATAAVFAAGVAVDRSAPFVGANAQIRRAAAQRADWRRGFDHEAGRALAWARAKGQESGLRRLEHGRAVASADAAQSACDARVAAARHTGLALNALLSKETPHDAQGCPVRRLLDADELRRALVPAGG